MKLCSRIKFILSAIGTTASKSWKPLLTYLTPSTSNKYTITWSGQKNSKLYLASLDFDSLFTNIPLDETISICIGNLNNANENHPKTPKF